MTLTQSWQIKLRLIWAIIRDQSVMYRVQVNDGTINFLAGKGISAYGNFTNCYWPQSVTINGSVCGRHNVPLELCPSGWVCPVDNEVEFEFTAGRNTPA